MLITQEEVKQLLDHHKIKINGVLHIGAHECEELGVYKFLGIKEDNVVWVEAIKEKVDEAISKGINHVYNVVISDEDNKMVTFLRTNNNQSSSILDLGTHSHHYPHIVVSKQESMISITIDSFLKEKELDKKQYNFWNFDIQGAELLALKGATDALKYVDILYMEVNTEEVYKNCGLMSEIDSFVHSYGFSRKLTKMTQQGWGDALYIRDNINVQDDLFYCTNSKTYPPFKNGLYLEEYFYNHIKHNNFKHDKNGRLYIPVMWTNFQIEHWFVGKKQYMQEILDKYIDVHPCDKGYFTVVQYDDGPLLKLPKNTIVYGSCSGDVILPLIYEDQKNILLSTPRKTFQDKKIFCSFVGTNTHTVRTTIKNSLGNCGKFEFFERDCWSAEVSTIHQSIFIDKTIDSKYALAPRGYGRSSFRFFEIFKLGTIPIYVWDDIEWLPYKEVLDYSKICISINIKDINSLDNILSSINEEKYKEMISNYEKIKHMFDLEYMCEYITTKKRVYVQIGTNNGHDLFRDKVLSDKPDIVILVEPNNNLIPHIKMNYRNINAIIINKAIYHIDGEIVSLYIPKIKDNNKADNGHAYGDAHFSLVPMNDWGDKENMQEIKAVGIKFDTLCSNFGIYNIDYLQIDTEGFDAHIIDMIDLDKIYINTIRYEKWPFNPDCFTKHNKDNEFLGNNGMTKTNKKLVDNGYSLRDIQDSDGCDIIAQKY